MILVWEDCSRHCSTSLFVCRTSSRLVRTTAFVLRIVCNSLCWSSYALAILKLCSKGVVVCHTAECVAEAWVAQRRFHSFDPMTSVIERLRAISRMPVMASSFPSSIASASETGIYVKLSGECRHLATYGSTNKYIPVRNIKARAATANRPIQFAYLCLNTAIPLKITTRVKAMENQRCSCRTHLFKFKGDLLSIVKLC